MIPPRPDQLGDHVVGEVPLTRNHRTADAVGGHHRAVPEIERLPHSPVGHVGDVEDDPRLAHRPEQLLRRRLQPALGEGAVDIGVVPEVGGPDDAQPGVPPEADVLRVGDRVGALHRQDVIHRGAGPRILPRLDRGLETGERGHRGDLAAPRHGPVVLEMPAAHGHRLLLGAHAVAALAVARLGARHDGAEHDPDRAPPHLREGHRAGTGVVVVGDLRDLVPLLLADFVRRQRQVAVPVEGVPRQVEMQVDYQWL